MAPHRFHRYVCPLPVRSVRPADRTPQCPLIVLVPLVVLVSALWDVDVHRPVAARTLSSCPRLTPSCARLLDDPQKRVEWAGLRVWPTRSAEAGSLRLLGHSKRPLGDDVLVRRVAGQVVDPVASPDVALHGERCVRCGDAGTPSTRSSRGQYARLRHWLPTSQAPSGLCARCRRTNTGGGNGWGHCGQRALSTDRCLRLKHLAPRRQPPDGPARVLGADCRRGGRSPLLRALSGTAGRRRRQLP